MAATAAVGTHPTGMHSCFQTYVRITRRQNEVRTYCLHKVSVRIQYIIKGAPLLASLIPITFEVRAIEEEIIV